MDEKERLIQVLASIFHENWRESRLQSNGIYKSRMEKSEDEEWTRKYGTDKVYVVNLVYEKVVKGEKITPKMIEKMSEIVHEEWLERNGKEGGFEN